MSSRKWVEYKNGDIVRVCRNVPTLPPIDTMCVVFHVEDDPIITTHRKGTIFIVPIQTRDMLTWDRDENDGPGVQPDDYFPTLRRFIELVK